MASAYAAPNAVVVPTENAGLIAAPVMAPPTRISWSAVLAGIVLVMAIEVLLGLLGAGIGLAVIQPGSSETPDANAFATNAGLWSLGTVLLALLAGGWAAARLAGVASRKDGMLHGLLIWALALLLAVYLLTAAVGGALSMLGGFAAAAGGGLRALAPQLAGVAGDTLGSQARALLQPPQGNDLANMSADDAQKEVARLLPDLAAGGDRAAQARGRIVDIMAVQSKTSHDDAARRLDEARARAPQGAGAMAGQGADAASRAALLAFAGLLVGAVAAGLGGALARPRLLQRANRLHR